MALVCEQVFRPWVSSAATASWWDKLQHRVAVNFEEQLSIPSLTLEMSQVRIVLLGEQLAHSKDRECSMVGCKQFSITPQLEGWAVGKHTNDSTRSVWDLKV